jgi:hypothetical protein
MGSENCSGNYCILLLPILNSKFEALSVLKLMEVWWPWLRAGSC